VKYFSKLYWLFPVILFVSCLPSTDSPSTTREVSFIEAANAVALAKTKEGFPYVWAGNGPDSFDCSGLIVWAYQEALDRDLLFTNGTETVIDVTMNDFYRYNTQFMQVESVIPGDLIFITDNENSITHGGLIIEVFEDNITFINASSFYGCVCVDTWAITDTIRNQWVAGYGRLIVQR